MARLLPGNPALDVLQDRDHIRSVDDLARITPTDD